MKNTVSEWYAQKKVVVTGGAGFIGSHLAETLVHYGARVTVIDNLVTGKMENLDEVRSHITFSNADIQESAHYIQALAGTDVLFHCAAQISVPESIENPDYCFDVNVQGTFTLLEAARLQKVKKMVFSSSCAVYGNQETACTETMPCAPGSPYAYSKLMGEQLCQQYAQIFNLPAICLRYFNVFGARQNPNGPYAGVRAQFTKAFQENRPITIFGDGTQTRDFIPVSAVVEANLLAGMAPDVWCTGQAVNVATEKSSSLLELLEELKKEYPDYPHTPLFAAARQGDIKHSQAHCDRFKALRKQVQQFYAR